MAKKTSPVLPVLVGGAVLVVASKKKKKTKSSHWGVRVVKGCDVEIVNDELFDRFIVGAFHELIDIDPDLDAFQLTDSMFGEVAPECGIFPEEPASDSAVDFYFLLLKANTRALLAKGLATKQEIAQHPRAQEFIEWYTYWRNPPSASVPAVPDNQVGFASDFSNYVIGPNWYAETVVPFVRSKPEDDDILTAFADERAVAVGKIAMPIAQLPIAYEAVEDFVDKLTAAIEQAKTEA